jgi:hypothetical protein
VDHYLPVLSFVAYGTPSITGFLRRFLAEVWPHLRPELAEATRRHYSLRMERDLGEVMALRRSAATANALQNRYVKVRAHPFTFLDHPDIGANNNGRNQS